MAFFKHPQEQGETYWQHAKVSLSIARRYAKCTVAAVVHAIHPDLHIPEHLTLKGMRKWIKEQSNRAT